MKTRDSPLKTEDTLLKTKEGPSVNRKLLTHILKNLSPIHRHPTWMITMAELKNGQTHERQSEKLKRQNNGSQTKHDTSNDPNSDRTTEVLIMAVREEDSPVNNARPLPTALVSVGPTLLQPTLTVWQQMNTKTYPILK